MAKRLFLLLLFSLTGIILSPDVLMADDATKINEIDFNATQTVEKLDTVNEIVGVDDNWNDVEKRVTDHPVKTTTNQSSASEVITSAVATVTSTITTATNVATTAPVMTVTAPAPAPSHTISIAGRTLNIVEVSDTLVDSGGHVNKYGNKFLYGHNSAGVFGGLVNMGVGSVFTINHNGVVDNYRVAKVVIFEKNSALGTLQLNGNGSYMNSVAKARFEKVNYDLSIMTCYGTSYGNGDASHRYVIFANKI